MPVLFLLILAALPVFGQTDTAVRIGPSAVRIVSGNLVHEEHLFRGGWRTRYWSPGAVIKPDAYLKTPGAAELPGLDEPIACAFGLSVDGQELWDNWQWVSAREVPCEQGAGCRHVVVELAHAIRPVGARVHTIFNGDPFFERRIEVGNLGKAPAAVGSVYPMSGYLFAARRLKENLPKNEPAIFSVLRPASFEAVREADFRWLPLPGGAHAYGGSKWALPFAAVRNAVAGELFLIHFGFSASYQFEFHNTHQPARDEAWLYFRAGLAGPGPFRVLKPGEWVTAPSVYIGHMPDDLDAAVQSLHAYLRQAVLPPMPPGRVRPVEYNSWGYVEDEISEEALKGAIDAAADSGAELFTIDAGWYADRNTNWWARAGDWRAGSRLPNGLEPVFAYARQKGLMCGMWVDIERIGRESQVFKEHPEWVVKIHGASGDHTALDFTNPEVVRFAEETLAGLIERYKLDVFRLDYNTELGRAGTQNARDGYLENSIWRHYDAVYAMYARLRKHFPNLMMENCASGGGRNDLGMLRNFHWTQSSDEWGSVRALKILNGFSLAFPPEYGQNYAGVISPENYRYGDADFRMRVLMFGHISLGGAAPNSREYPAALKRRIRHHVDLYKRFIRPILPSARVYHHTPVVPNTEAGDWVVIEHAAPDRARGYAGVFRLAAAEADWYLFRPRGLDPGKTYRVTLDNLQSTTRLSGAALMTDGLRLRIGPHLGSEMVLFEAER